MQHHRGGGGVSGGMARVVSRCTAVSGPLSSSCSSSSPAWGCSRSGGGGGRAAMVSPSRTFYAGLDESRVHRLRRSGMTFNRPRGRDTFSVAFESRLRIVPLTAMADLYRPVHLSLQAAAAAATVADPTSSTGNALETRKAMAGDARVRKVVEAKRRSEASWREKHDWHVLVVDPIAHGTATSPVPFPNPHLAYYQDWPSSPHEGGGTATRVLEQRLAPAFGTATADSSSPTETAASPQFPCWFYSHATRRQLQQSGDTALLQGSRARHTTWTTAADHQTDPASTPRTVCEHFHTAVCVDPDISPDRFYREEAQVEMISAYRNILYEAVELAQTSDAAAGGSLRRSSATRRAAPFVADVVRVPALCHYSCGPRFLHELGKLNQQSVIKGFHRLSNEAKEALITNSSFTMELYVPPMLLGQFERAFLEEAWETPHSALHPGRTALYPGLAPPRTLLQYDGWIGRRQELVDGIETQGRSLLRGPTVGLDGRLVEECEVLANLRVFGAREEQQRMLEGEQRTAVAQLELPGGEPASEPPRTGTPAEDDVGNGAAATDAAGCGHEGEAARHSSPPVSLTSLRD
ncbi:hypothetical protein NESM_000527600 [Novymonas esmeraldas]|uniref:Uncharacterized protein n=1 Tax=Novymonas esmeraldas TaxID=1808958 RepID=A0AAW0EQF9_9TRYP